MNASASKSPLYAFPQMGRTGLANMLYPWARAELFCRDQGAMMIAPQWAQFMLGPWLRGDRDKRSYLGLFSNAGYVHGLKKRYLLWRSTKVSEFDFAPEKHSARPLVVTFTGMKEEFNPLFGHHAFISSRLHAILSKNTAAMLNATQKDWTIGVHVRRGDFQVRTTDLSGSPSAGQPESWFVDALRQVRSAVGWDAPARVFSDARPQDLPALMAEPQVSMRVEAPAIVELLSMAQSDVLITSARSTFSHWATFLGQMPSLWYPTIGRVMNPAADSLFQETSATGEFPSAFADMLRQRVGPKRA